MGNHTIRFNVDVNTVKEYLSKNLATLDSRVKSPQIHCVLVTFWIANFFLLTMEILSPKMFAIQAI